MAGRRRTQELTQRPGFEDTKEAALLGTMYGSVDTVKHNIKELSDIGAEYILLNSPNGLTSLETFASVIMPEFSNNLTVASP